MPLLPRGASSGVRLALNYLSFVISAILIGYVRLRKQKFDLIFVPNYSPATVGIPGVFFSKIKCAPMMFWVQDLWPESLSATGMVKSNLIMTAIKWMMKYIYNNSDLIAVQSRAFVKEIQKLVPIDREIYYLPNWAEDIFTRPNCTAPPSIDKEIFSEETTNIVFAGNLGEAQSLTTILKAAEKLRNYPVKWIILGDGRKRDVFEQQVINSDLSQKIIFLGNQPLEHMPWYFSKSDAMLVTLENRKIFDLTIPGKIQSYLASGVPIIAALNGEGAKVIKESKSGRVVNSGDHVGLAAAVRDFCSSSQTERLMMGRSGRDYYLSHFDRNIVITKFELEMQQLGEQK